MPQYIPDYCEHSFYTFSCQYLGHKYKDKTWKQFYDEFVRRGGDGFYACVKNPYLEPSIINLFKADFKDEFAMCPKAEELQRDVMCFKTNYRDMNKFKKQSNILLELLSEW